MPAPITDLKLAWASIGLKQHIAVFVRDEATGRFHLAGEYRALGWTDIFPNAKGRRH